MVPAAPAEAPSASTCTCRSARCRCGYCDFNTYTATELGGGGSQAAYAGHAVAEVEYAAHRARPGPPEVATVFFGGGTPTLLPADDLVRILAAIDDVLRAGRRTPR